MKTLLNSNVVNNTSAIFGGILGWYLGPIDGLLTFLVTLVISDYVTGLLRAYHDHELSSRVGRKGITKKFMIFVIVGLANLLDVHIFGGESAVLRTAAISFYASNEGLSIVENAIQIGLPVPPKIKEALKQIKHSEDKDAES